MTDLETQRRAIVEQVAKADPVQALALMWRFLRLANSVFECSDDSSGTVIAAFEKAVVDLGEIATAARPDPTTPPDELFQALTDNGPCPYGNLIGVLAPAVAAVGLEHLESRMLALSGQPVGRLSAAKRQVLGYGLSGPVHADEMSCTCSTHEALPAPQITSGEVSK